MIRDFRYILKKIIILTSVAILVYLFKVNFVNAATVDGTITWGVDQQSVVSITTGDYKYVPASNARMFWLTGLGEEDAPTTYYFNLLLCVNTSSTNITGAAWSDNSLPNSSNITVKNTGINITNVPCKFVGAYPGKVVQVTSATQAYNGDISLAFKVSINQDVSYQIINYSIANEPYTLIESQQDYTDLLNTMMTTITNTWQTQINKLQDIWQVDQATLAEAQSQTGWQKRMAEAAEAFNQAVNDDNIDGSFQSQKMSEISGKGYNNNSIGDLILLPLRIMNGMVDGLASNSCNPFNLGTFYDHTIILPCVTSSQMSGWLGTAYNIIDLFIAFGVILGIRSVCIKIYKTIIFMREGSVD